MQSLNRAARPLLSASSPLLANSLKPLFPATTLFSLSLPSTSSSVQPVSIRHYAKKSKKGGKSSSADDLEEDDPHTMVIKTKGKASRKSAAFATTGKKGKGDGLVAGEEPIEAGEVDAVEAHDESIVEKAREKMEKTVNWCRASIFDGVERGTGRVSPALLDSVRVNLPGTSGSEPLQSVAGVTVRQNTLWVEVYDHDSMKPVESAIHQANLPGISPTRHDDRTLKIPVSRPTKETRDAIIKTLSDAGEQAKTQIRIARTDALKHIKHKSGKNSDSGKEAQKLTDKYCAEVDGLVAQGKKELAKA